MELIVDREWKKQNYTLSNLTIDGELKKPSITAILKGTYEITLDVISPKYCTNSFYKQVCNGKVPRLLNVKGFEGILIHAGNTDKGEDITIKIM